MDLGMVSGAVAPVLFLLGVGFLAGRTGQIGKDQAKGLSVLVLRYAIPAALFLGMAHFDRHVLLDQGPMIVILVIYYLGAFLLCYALLKLLHAEAMRAVLVSYAATSKSVTVYGLAVLPPVFGVELSRAFVGLNALVIYLVQVSVVIYLAQSAMAAPGQKPSILGMVRRTLTDSLVWAPCLGALVSLNGIRLPPLVDEVLDPLAQAASSVAIFAVGLGFASLPLKLGSRMVLVTSAVCLFVHPAMFFLLVKAWGLSGAIVQAAFVASMMPTATTTFLFAVRYGTDEAEMASILLLTTLALVVTLPLGLWLMAYI